MFCTACGTKNPADANFCKRCGQKIEKTETPAITEEEFALPKGTDERFNELLLLAFQKNEAGDIDEALRACREALELRPTSTDAHSLMSTLYEKKGDVAKAIAEREKVLELNPGSIADREKLDLLRDGTLQIKPRKITTVRRTSRAVLFDTPAGAAVAAVAVTLLVFLVGAWAVMARGSGKPPTTAVSPPRPSLPVSPGVTAPNLGAYSQNAGAGAPGAPSNVASTPSMGAYTPWNSPPASQMPSAQPGADAARRPAPDQDARGMVPRNSVFPLQVAPPAAAPLEREARPNGSAQPDNNNTFYLPDETPPARPPEPTTGTGNNTGAAPSRPGPGRIEITVSPDSPGGKTDARGAASPPDSKSDPHAPTMESRARRAGAQQYQLQGNYRNAVKEYLKALDGAGDDAASIHQQLALCYQRLDEKENAIAHYQQAIDAYKALIAAGRNTEIASRGLKASEAGLRAIR